MFVGTKTADSAVDCRQPLLWPDGRLHCPNHLGWCEHSTWSVNAQLRRDTYLGKDNLHLFEFARGKIDAFLRGYSNQPERNNRSDDLSASLRRLLTVTGSLGAPGRWFCFFRSRQNTYHQRVIWKSSDYEEDRISTNSLWVSLGSRAHCVVFGQNKCSSRRSQRRHSLLPPKAKMICCWDSFFTQIDLKEMIIVGHFVLAKTSGKVRFMSIRTDVRCEKKQWHQAVVQVYCLSWKLTRPLYSENSHRIARHFSSLYIINID